MDVLTLLLQYCYVVCPDSLQRELTCLDSSSRLRKNRYPLASHTRPTERRVEGVLDPCRSVASTAHFYLASRFSTCPTAFAFRR